MKNKTIIFLFILNSVIINQEIIGENLYSVDLINFLKENYTTSNVLSYNNARDIMYSEIDNIDGMIYGIYTNYSIQLDPNQDPSQYLYDNGMDCEHVWPQSMYEGSSPMKSDMHHLRACKSNVNSSRGNKPFNEINDTETNSWFWLTSQLSFIPQSNLDEYSESGSQSFEPREDVKGDIARSMFYFYTIYSDVAYSSFFEEQKDVLYQWHTQDITTDQEIERTLHIAEYQNDIANPFILDNTLVYRAYFYISEEFETGDINLDGLINVVDIVTLVNYILGLGSINSMQVADLDGNNEINIVDVVLLVNLVLE